MKKRLLSFITALVMLAGFCIPVSAAGITSEKLELIPVDVGQALTITATDDDILVQGMMETEAGSSLEDVNEEGSVYAIRNWAAPQVIRIWPLIQHNQTGDVYYFENLVRTKYWTDNAQFQGFHLSPSAVSAFQSELDEILTNSSDGDEYSFYGWRIATGIYLTATLPRRLEFKQSFPQSSEVYETISESIATQYTTVTLTGIFKMPSTLNPSSNYSMGFTGAFYFLYASGTNVNKEGGISFNSSVTMNSTI